MINIIGVIRCHRGICPLGFPHLARAADPAAGWPTSRAPDQSSGMALETKHGWSKQLTYLTFSLFVPYLFIIYSLFVRFLKICFYSADNINYIRLGSSVLFKSESSAMNAMKLTSQSFHGIHSTRGHQDFSGLCPIPDSTIVFQTGVTNIQSF